MKTYFVIGSFYGGERLERLHQVLRYQDMGHDYSVLTNEQCGLGRKPRGFAYVYNRLLRAAFSDPECQFAWVLGDDIMPQGLCLPRVQAVMEADESIGSIFPVEVWKNAEGNLVSCDMTGAEVSRDVALTLGPECMDQIFSGFACTCIRRAAWEKTGEMDEGLGRGYAEDLDWCIRAWAAGWRSVNYRRDWFLHETRGSTFNQMIKDGVFGEREAYDAADRAKVKWPWLWNGEPFEVTIERLHEMRRQAK